MAQLRLALAQVNPTVGDLAGNATLIAEAVGEAADRGAHLVVLPEMALTGYPLEDLALRRSLIKASRKAISQLATTLADDGLAGIVAVVGYLDGDPDDGADDPDDRDGDPDDGADDPADRDGDPDDGAEDPADRDGSPSGTLNAEPSAGLPKNQPRNAVAVLHGGNVVARQFKHHLWNYGVGDEMRNYIPGDTLNLIQVRGVDVAIAICEDLWQDGPSAAADAAEAGLLVVPNGSPYERNKDDVRLELCARRAREGACALGYVNLVGGQDELVFDGDSLVVDANGDLVARAAQFVPEVLVVDLDLPAATAPMPDPDARFFGLRVERTVISSEPVAAYEPFIDAPAERLDDLAEIYSALGTGLRDYVTKNGFRTVLMGLSGGIDSTLVATIAVDALDASNVFGVSNPSAWSSDHSKSDAAELARRTGLQLDVVGISSMVDAFNQAVKIDGLAEENLQARIRAVIWMALSNQHGHLVLACGNKSELATGYSTIYGDAVGGYAPIKDVPKTLVWELAKWRNAEAERRGELAPIPESVITKLPSAELRPGQLDSDSLPPYELLDAVLDAYVERDLGSAQLLAEGFDADLVTRVIGLVDKAEYKRRQYPTGPKISQRNFGRDRRVPITNAWRESY